jgi:hypothetical protein
MGMEACNGMGMAHMNLPMNMKGRAFWRPFSSKDVTVEIADQQAGCCDFIECVTERIDQKKRRVSRHQCREVVADALMEAESRSHAKARSEVDARLPYSGRI